MEAVVSTKPTTTFAYVTFLAGNGDYIKGVIGLAKGLRKTKTKYPLIVAVLPDVPTQHRQLLLSQNCIVKEIKPVNPPDENNSNYSSFAMAYYIINYSKLRIWEFVEYTKLIYLDGDIQVYDNIDHLFNECNEDGCIYAALDCFCEKTWESSTQYKIGYCQQCPNRVFWDESVLGAKPSLYFNAGMFVFQPSLVTYHQLLKTLELTPPSPFAEQDFLNMYFKDMYRPIPQIYNLVMALIWQHPYNIELDKIKVVHYCAYGAKPWSYTGEEKNMDREDIRWLIKKWWDIYNDPSLDYLPNTGVRSDDHVKAAALKKAGGHAAVRYITAPSAA